MPCDSVVSSTRRVSLMVFTSLLLLPTLAFAQSPWERAASTLERTFTGPLARSLMVGYRREQRPHDQVFCDCLLR
jgi:hypothetical protein